MGQKAKSRKAKQKKTVHARNKDLKKIRTSHHIKQLSKKSKDIAMIQITTPCKKKEEKSSKTQGKMLKCTQRKKRSYDSPTLSAPVEKSYRGKDSFFHVKNAWGYARIKFAPPSLKQKMNFLNLYRGAFTRLDLFYDEGSHLNVTKKRYKERRETKDDKNPYDA